MEATKSLSHKFLFPANSNSKRDLITEIENDLREWETTHWACWEEEESDGLPSNPTHDIGNSQISEQSVRLDAFLRPNKMKRTKVHKRWGHALHARGMPQVENEDNFTGNQTTVKKEYINTMDPRYQYITSLLVRDYSLHFSQLSGSALRASTSIVCKSSGVAMIMMWAVTSTGYDVQSVPIVNCSDSDTKQLLTVCKAIVQKVLAVEGAYDYRRT